MKNQFSFKNLKSNGTIEDENECSQIFYKILDFTSKDNLTCSTSDFCLAKTFFQDDCYHILHNLFYQKGKRKIFKGKVFSSEKNAIFDFLEKSIQTNDLRDFFIFPYFTDTPNYVISIYDEVFYIYKKPLSPVKNSAP